MALGTLHNFEMHRGDSRTITGTVVDDSEPAVVVDLTGISGTALSWILIDLDTNLTEIGPRGSVPIVTKTIASGITITDAVNGEVEIDLASADTTGLKVTNPRELYHELQLQLSGKTTTVLFGVITLRKDIVAPGP